MSITLSDALAPMAIEDLREHYFGKKAFVQVRDEPRFRDLLTLEQLENRLNDGCGALLKIAAIGPDGSKYPRERVYLDTVSGQAWSPFLLKKTEVRQLLEAGHSLILHNMAQVNQGISDLLGSIERAFPGTHADLHVYLSPRAGATKYKVHRDAHQHKIYLQLIGTTEWTVYLGSARHEALTEDEVRERLTPDFSARLTPGSLLYMPPGVFHRVASTEGPRVSLSIPIAYVGPKVSAPDRSHIPLARIMAEAMERA